MEDYKKKYEEAMLRMNKWVEGSEIIGLKEVAEFVFPEIKESEDEMVRKWFIKAMKHLSEGSTFFLEVPKDKVIDWLKKQGEQKPVWSEEDEKMWITISDLLWEGFKLSDEKVSWDKIRCWLLPKITYFKDRVQTHPKQEWSEEDENGLGDALWAVQQARSIAKDENEMGGLWYAEKWLKSLKERYTWKPSDEQMKVLNEVINYAAEHQSMHWNDYVYNILKQFKSQLKKLKGE